MESASTPSVPALWSPISTATTLKKSSGQRAERVLLEDRALDDPRPVPAVFAASDQINGVWPGVSPRFRIWKAAAITFDWEMQQYDHTGFVR